MAESISNNDDEAGTMEQADADVQMAATLLPQSEYEMAMDTFCDLDLCGIQALVDNNI